MSKYKLLPVQNVPPLADDEQLDEILKRVVYGRDEIKAAINRSYLSRSVVREAILKLVKSNSEMGTGDSGSYNTALVDVLNSPGIVERIVLEPSEPKGRGE